MRAKIILFISILFYCGNLFSQFEPVSTNKNNTGGGGVLIESDPTVPAHVKSISSGNISTWNAKQAALVSGVNIRTIEGQTLLGATNIDLTKADVGLSNVDNTTDLNKPISIATQTALDTKQATLISGTNLKTVNTISLLGSGNITIAGGGSDGDTLWNQIATQQVNMAGFKITDLGTPTVGTDATTKTYVDNADAAKQTTLVSGTNIKTLETINLLGSGNIDLTKSDVGLNNVDNTTDLNKPISTATQTALNNKVSLTGDENVAGEKTFTDTLKTTETIQVTSNGANEYLNLWKTSKSSLTHIPGFTFTGGEFANPSPGTQPNNYVYNFGSNFNSGAGLRIAGKPAYGLGFEDRFYIGGDPHSEFHVLAVDENGIQRRPVTCTFKFDGTENNWSHFLKYWNMHDNSGTKQVWQLNTASEVWNFGSGNQFVQSYFTPNYQPFLQNDGTSNQRPLIGYLTTGGSRLQLGNPSGNTIGRIGQSFDFGSNPSFDYIGTALGDGALDFHLGIAGKKYNTFHVNANYEIMMRFTLPGNSNGWAHALNSSNGFYLYDYTNNKNVIEFRHDRINFNTALGFISTFATSGSGVQNGSIFKGTDGDPYWKNDVGTVTNLLAGGGGGISGSGTATRLAYWSGSSSLTSDANLYYDDVFDRLGIKNSSPSVELDVIGRANIEVGTDNLFINGGNTTLSGNSNMAIGDGSLNDLTSGSYNSAIGVLSAPNITSGVNNISIGYQTMNTATTAGSNIAIGNQTLYTNLGGFGNTAIGGASLVYYTGDLNTAVGYGSLTEATTGHSNTAVGYSTMSNITTGIENVAFGYETLRSGTSSTASQNSAFGYQSGRNVTGSGNVFLGYAVAKSQTNISNQLWIDNGDVALPLIKGDFNADSLIINGTLKYTTSSSANASKLSGLAVDGFFKDITLGANLSLSTAGVLSATGGGSGNYVTLNTEDTITASKYFETIGTDNVIIGDINNTGTGGTLIIDDYAFKYASSDFDGLYQYDSDLNRIQTVNTVNGKIGFMNSDSIGLFNPVGNNRVVIKGDEAGNTASILIRSPKPISSLTPYDVVIKQKLDSIYQEKLISGTNLKTINGNSLLGSGNISITASPGGSSGEFQFNNAGSLAGVTNVIAEGNNLGLLNTTTPSTPASGKVVIYSKSMSGRTGVFWKDEFGDETEIGSNPNDVNESILIPVNGNSWAAYNIWTTTATGTLTSPTISTTSLGGSTKRVDIVASASSGAIAGWRQSGGLDVWRGDTPGEGGFDFSCKWTPAAGATVSTTRSFTGFRAVTTAPTDIEPSTQIDVIGFGWDAADNNIQFMTNDNNSTCTKIDLGSNFPVPNTVNQTVYDMRIFCAPNGSTIYYWIKDKVSGNIASGSVTTNIPSNSTLLAPGGWISVGGTNSTIAYGFIKFRMLTSMVD